MAYDPTPAEASGPLQREHHEVIPTPASVRQVFCPGAPARRLRSAPAAGERDAHAPRVGEPARVPFFPSRSCRAALYDQRRASIVTSLDAMTGRTLWQGRLGMARREGFSASPVAVDGKVFFTNDEGETFVLRAGPTFELLHVNRLGESTLASPALVDGRWYMRTARNLIAIGRDHEKNRPCGHSGQAAGRSNTIPPDRRARNDDSTLNRPSSKTLSDPSSLTMVRREDDGISRWQPTERNS